MWFGSSSKLSDSDFQLETSDPHTQYPSLVRTDREAYAKASKSQAISRLDPKIPRFCRQGGAFPNHNSSAKLVRPRLHLILARSWDSSPRRSRIVQEPQNAH